MLKRAGVPDRSTSAPARPPISTDVAACGGDVVGVDWRLPLDKAWARIGHDRPIQGNLDPDSRCWPHGENSNSRSTTSWRAPMAAPDTSSTSATASCPTRRRIRCGGWLSMCMRRQEVGSGEWGLGMVIATIPVPTAPHPYPHHHQHESNPYHDPNQLPNRRSDHGLRRPQFAGRVAGLSGRHSQRATDDAGRAGGDLQQLSPDRRQVAAFRVLQRADRGSARAAGPGASTAATWACATGRPGSRRWSARCSRTASPMP